MAKLCKRKGKYDLPEQDTDDSLTFLLSPTELLVEHDEDNMLDPMIRPGIPGLWSGSDSWIGK